MASRAMRLRAAVTSFTGVSVLLVVRRSSVIVSWSHNRDGLTSEGVDAYVRAFSRPGALRAGFGDYRAHERDLA